MFGEMKSIRCHIHQRVPVGELLIKSYLNYVWPSLMRLAEHYYNYEWDAYKSNVKTRWYKTWVKSNFLYFDCNENQFLVLTVAENWFSFTMACQFFTWSMYFAFTLLELEYPEFDLDDYMTIVGVSFQYWFCLYHMKEWMGMMVLHKKKCSCSFVTIGNGGQSKYFWWSSTDQLCLSPSFLYEGEQ